MNSIDETLNADVCIIGSGAGGAMVASHMSRFPDLKVVLIEEGKRMDVHQFTQNEEELFPQLFRDQGAQATKDLGVAVVQGKVFGGSTTVNWMTCLRTPAHVLQQWEDEFGLSEYNANAMEPYFESVEKRLSVHTIPDSMHNPQNRLLLEGAKKLGYKVQASKNNSVNCIGCGFCTLGCKYNAKQDMRLTYLSEAEKNGITVFPECKALKIRYINPDNQEVITKKNGRLLQIKCRRTVIAAGAIHSPVLLQDSKLASKTTGKYLHLHPTTGSVGYYDSPVYASYGIPQSVYCDEFSNIDGNGYGFVLEVPPFLPGFAGINIIEKE